MCIILYYYQKFANARSFLVDNNNSRSVGICITSIYSV